MCLSEVLQIHTVAEASQAIIQVLSIDFKRWMKAGIKDGMQFVSAKRMPFPGSVACSSSSSIIAGGCLDREHAGSSTQRIVFSFLTF